MNGKRWQLIAGRSTTGISAEFPQQPAAFLVSPTKHIFTQIAWMQIYNPPLKFPLYLVDQGDYGAGRHSDLKGHKSQGRGRFLVVYCKSVYHWVSQSVRESVTTFQVSDRLDQLKRCQSNLQEFWQDLLVKTFNQGGICQTKLKLVDTL